jgi:hypothetical protein
MAVVVKGIFNIFLFLTKVAFKATITFSAIAGVALFTNPDKNKLLQIVKSDIKSETQTDSIIKNFAKNTIIDNLPLESMTEYKNFYIFSIAQVAGKISYLGVFGNWFRLPSQK